MRTKHASTLRMLAGMHEKGPPRTPEFPQERRRQELMSWSYVPEVRTTFRDGADHSSNLEMTSNYLLIKKEGGTSYLKKKMTTTVLDGNLKMMRVYKRNGRELRKVVQIACHTEVEEDFLAAM